MRVRWDPKAHADLRRVPRDKAVEILDALTRYGGKRAGDVARLRGELTPMLRLRVGDWRVFFVEPEPGELRIIRVFHRGEAYR